MTGWIALSDRDGLIAPCDNGALLARGVLVLELALPLPRGAVLLSWQGRNGWERALSVFADTAGGVTILHRQGRASATHRSGPLDGLPDQGVLRLVLAWDAPRRAWQLTATLPGSGRPDLHRRGRDPLPLPAADIAALCAPEGPEVRHPAVQWFGLADDAAACADRGAWIGPQTPVLTPDGPRPAAALAVGEVVLTDRGPVLLARVDIADRPGRGSQAPVLLRPPYFGRGGDLLVAAATPVALTGPDAEYLCGQERVLIRAADLCDGQAALRDPRRAVVRGVTLDLAAPGLILADGVALAPASPRLPDLPLLDRWQATPLVAGRGRGLRPRAA